MSTKVDDARNEAFLREFDKELARKKLSAEQVAELGGFDSSSITHIRKNRKNVGLTLMRKIARALKMDEDYVISWASTATDFARGNDEVEKDVQKIRQLYKRMSPESRDRYISIGELFVKNDDNPPEKASPRSRAAKART